MCNHYPFLLVSSACLKVKGTLALLKTVGLEESGTIVCILRQKNKEDNIATLKKKMIRDNYKKQQPLNRIILVGGLK